MRIVQLTKNEAIRLLIKATNKAVLKNAASDLRDSQKALNLTLITEIAKVQLQNILADPDSLIHSLEP